MGLQALWKAYRSEITRNIPGTLTRTENGRRFLQTALIAALLGASGAACTGTAVVVTATTVPTATGIAIAAFSPVLLAPVASATPGAGIQPASPTATAYTPAVRSENTPTSTAQAVQPTPTPIVVIVTVVVTPTPVAGEAPETPTIVSTPVTGPVLSEGAGSTAVSNSPFDVPVPTATQTATPAPTPTPVPTPVAPPSPTPVPSPDATPFPTSTSTPVATETATPTNTPTATATHTPTPTATPDPSPVPFVDRNCGDFSTWDDAYAFFLAEGGPAEDPHRLDNDNDGIPCESLPGAPD